MAQEHLLTKIDNLWKQWDQTRNPKYKDLWYKTVKEWADGRNNTKRRAILSFTSDKRLVRRSDFTKRD
tara:strand:- start:458 stop:661 length:204 start_codon:yes stop_codon:yes gene_type:complete